MRYSYYQTYHQSPLRACIGCSYMPSKGDQMIRARGDGCFGARECVSCWDRLIMGRGQAVTIKCEQKTQLGQTVETSNKHLSTSTEKKKWQDR